ncbi:hypothetical protein Geob_3852 [Geotalea daltonii FRC-32]|uniref:Uncharacterized protein n=1 Tax=Geotalea daltonii (strain DSM 22248 / JCM 15807 / FRC-32) TaxID=316067 RepID=A0A068F226_GEODF|nr:hypothetical protein [Geotalea daltonii]AID57974.1 hypothetical protein Geob_3852 [Geotalea daltonii FRC-32]
MISGGLLGGSEACGSVASFLGYSNYLTLAGGGGAGDYCRNHADDILGILAATKEGMLTWVAKATDAEIVARFGGYVASKAAIVAAVIQVFKNWEDIVRPENKIWLFTFTLSLSWLTTLAMGASIEAGGPFAGTILALEIGFFSMEMLDKYVAMLKGLERQSFIPSRRYLLSSIRSSYEYI